MRYTAGMKPSAVLAPELLRAAMRAVSGSSMLPMMGKRASFRIRLLFARSSQECERKQ